MTKKEFLELFYGLAKKYQPAQAVKDNLKEVELLIVVGPSGVGKTSIIDNSGIKYIPSDTTRSKRQGEVDGRDMFFRDDYEDIVNELSNGEFVQVAIGPAGDFYATRGSAYPKQGFATMPVVADVVPILRNIGFKRTVTIFVVPPSFDEWMKRMKSHELTKDQLSKRLFEARRSFEFGLGDKETHYILNDGLNEAVEEVKELLSGIIDKERESKAKATAEIIYRQLVRL